MNPQQIDRDLAEKVMGWTWSEDACGRLCWVDSEWSPAVIGDWSPSTSRDDAHEVLGRLTDEQRKAALEKLWDSCPEESQTSFRWDWYLLTATPAQISEAVWMATCQ